MMLELIGGLMARGGVMGLCESRSGRGGCDYGSG
jgi:hypothetical protein